MSRVTFSALFCICFAAGWWMDAWVGSSESSAVNKIQPRGNRVEESAALPSPGEKPAAEENPAGSIRSVEDLLELVVPGRKHLNDARLPPAVSKLDASRLADFAARLEKIYYSDERARPAMAAVVKSWMQRDPFPAVEFALAREDWLMSEIHGDFYTGMARVFEKDLPAATRLMAGIKDRELYIYARYWCIETLEGRDPREALELIVEFDGKTRNQSHGAQALGKFPEDWVTRDATAAMTWAMALPPSYTRNRILGEMTTAWGRMDAEAALAFIRETPPELLPRGNLRQELEGYIHPDKADDSGKN